MKTYVLIVSRKFPATHKRKGGLTHFPELIQKTLGLMNYLIYPYKNKIHTLRSNYKGWKKRIEEIQKGNAILSIRYWEKSGGCYVKGNTQIEICKLDKDSGIGIQKLEFQEKGLDSIPIINERHGDVEDYSFEILSKNDGLSFEDFKEWFKKYDLSKPMAIIHFTHFRY